MCLVGLESCASAMAMPGQNDAYCWFCVLSIFLAHFALPGVRRQGPGQLLPYSATQATRCQGSLPGFILSSLSVFSSFSPWALPPFPPIPAHGTTQSNSIVVEPGEEKQGNQLTVSPQDAGGDSNWAEWRQFLCSQHHSKSRALQTLCMQIFSNCPVKEKRTPGSHSSPRCIRSEQWEWERSDTSSVEERRSLFLIKGRMKIIRTGRQVAAGCFWKINGALQGACGQNPGTCESGMEKGRKASERLFCKMQARGAPCKYMVVYWSSCPVCTLLRNSNQESPTKTTFWCLPLTRRWQFQDGPWRQNAWTCNSGSTAHLRMMWPWASHWHLCVSIFLFTKREYYQHVLHVLLLLLN